jgi:hypothetical protein
MNTNTEPDTSEEFDTFQSGHPDGKILHLDEDDNDFILELFDLVIERLTALEAVAQRIESRLERLP